MIRAIVTLVGAVVVLAVCVAVALLRGHTPALALADGHAPAPNAAVSTATPAPTPWLAVVVPAGEVAVVAPAGGGRLASIDVRLGDRVAAGQVVARLDPERARQDLAEARAQLAARTAARRQAAARRAKARDALDRIEQLGDLIAEAERSAATIELAGAQADFDRSAAEVEVERVRIAQIESIVRDTALLAPLGGEVVARTLDPGARAEPGATIVRIVDRERRLRLALPPDAAVPELGATLDVRCGDRGWRAAVTQIAPHVDPAARVILVEARPLTDDGLRLGDTCRATPATGR